MPPMAASISSTAVPTGISAGSIRRPRSRRNPIDAGWAAPYGPPPTRDMNQNRATFFGKRPCQMQVREQVHLLSIAREPQRLRLRFPGHFRFQVTFMPLIDLVAPNGILT